MPVHLSVPRVLGAVVVAMAVAACGDSSETSAVPEEQAPESSGEATDVSDADVAACEFTGEALSAFESPEYRSVAGMEFRTQEIEQAVRLAALEASEAQSDTIRDRGIQASQAFRSGDPETAYLHLRSVAVACRESGIEVNVEPREPDPRWTVEGVFCAEVDRIEDPEDPTAERYRFGALRDLYAVVDRELEFLRSDASLGPGIMQFLYEQPSEPSVVMVERLREWCADLVTD